MTFPLILIHGAGCDRTIWPEALRNRSDLEVYALDLPGHGEAGGATRSTVDAYADDVLAFLESKKISRAVLCGHSMGGAISLTIALRVPEKVAGLILVATGARLRVDSRTLFFIRHPWLFRLAVPWITRRSFPKGISAEGRKAAMALVKRVNIQVLGNDLEACNRFNVMDRVSEVKAPTFLISGREDVMTPLKYSQFLKDRISGATWEIFEETDHFITLEKPEELTACIVSWMKKPIAPRGI